MPLPELVIQMVYVTTWPGWTTSGVTALVTVRSAVLWTVVVTLSDVSLTMTVLRMCVPLTRGWTTVTWKVIVIDSSTASEPMVQVNPLPAVTDTGAVAVSTPVSELMLPLR